MSMANFPSTTFVISPKALYAGPHSTPICQPTLWPPSLRHGLLEAASGHFRARCDSSNVALSRSPAPAGVTVSMWYAREEDTGPVSDQPSHHYSSTAILRRTTSTFPSNSTRKMNSLSRRCSLGIRASTRKQLSCPCSTLDSDNTVSLASVL
jgi:hypothetical protein